MVFGRSRNNLRVAALATCAAVLLAGSAGTADERAAPVKPAAGTAEQSPEEAAGGRENFMRLKKACKADASRLCKQVRPGGGRILQCLREHDSELATGCREAVNAGKPKP
jgi:hypothetical protein